MKKGLPAESCSGGVLRRTKGGPLQCITPGLDLSRKRLDFHLLDG